MRGESGLREDRGLEEIKKILPSPPPPQFEIMGASGRGETAVSRNT